MVKFIERIGTKTTVDKKPIDLGTLVNMGSELIFSTSSSYYDSGDVVKRDCGAKAIELAHRYGCSYVMMGKNYTYLGGDGGPNVWIFLATFFNDRQSQ